MSSKGPTRRGLIFTGTLAASVASTSRRLHADVIAPHQLSFLVLGDWGYRPDLGGEDHGPHAARNQRRVAEAMAEWADAHPIDFVISTGDNFYPGGALDVNDPVFWSAFEQVYTAETLHCPWYLTLGNHDRRGKPMAQVAYTTVSDRWRMPSAFHRQSMALAGGRAIDFFFLDTTAIRAEARELNAGEVDDGDEDQLQWLDQVLSASKATWKIVVGHHPVYSGGVHGNTQEMIDYVQPILRKHGVHVYLNGHDHDLQHIAVDGIHYLTSGAGASTRPVESIAGTRFAAESNGFLAVRLSEGEMLFEFIDAAGRRLYGARIDQVG